MKRPLSQAGVILRALVLVQLARVASSQLLIDRCGVASDFVGDVQHAGFLLVHLCDFLSVLEIQVLAGHHAHPLSWEKIKPEGLFHPSGFTIAFALHGLDVPRVYHDNALVRDVLDYTEADQFDVALMNPPYGGSEKADVKNHFPDDLASSETADLFMAVIMYRLKKGGRAAVILPDGFLFGTDNAKVNLKKKLLSEFNLHTIIRLPGSVFSPYTSITTNILFFDRTGPTRETWYYRLDMPEGYKHFSKTKPMKLEHFAPVMEWWNDRREISEDGFDKAKKFPVEQLTGELGYNLDQCSYPHEEEEILAPLDLIHRYEEQRASLNAEIDRVLAEITAKLGGDAL